MVTSNSNRPTILIIDDVEQIRLLLRELLSEHECVLAASAEEALAVLENRRFNLVLSDINMPGISGIDLVPRILAKSPETVVVMVSGEQTIESAIEAMRAGAFDYVTKPLDLRHVHAAVDRALAQHKLLSEKRRYEDHLEELVKERTAEIEHLAYYDRLTDLPNRSLFADRCAQAMAIAQRKEGLVGVLLVALDRFKKVTETLGHAAGDVVIMEAAARLEKCVAEGDTLARIDGDEFALLLTAVRDSGDLAEASLEIAEVFKDPFHLAGHQVYVTTSTGISVFPNNGEDASTILKNAGAALYRAKKMGGNNYQYYAAHMNSQAVRRLALETGMRHAIENHEFIPYYQPIVNLATTEVIGAEALLRWHHPDEGVLLPARFIAVAEDTGLILDIGEKAMRTACAQTRAWHDQGCGSLNIAVNVSARQLRQKHFLDRLVETLIETRLDPTYVELELTETTIMENTDVTGKLLAQIRNLGMKVAIDDFGTGYSSLSYLKKLPIDTVKLDRSFVRGATTDPDDAALVMAIITLAHNLKLKVIAEGVETPEQLTFLRLLRCDEAQGFLFGKAVPADVFEASIVIDPRRKGHARSNSRRATPDMLRIVKE
ncbi:MAG: putative bifunctional diguanylate cyclase/phosphodiesterase [Pyrinomonadaceae bacterium]